MNHPLIIQRRRRWLHGHRGRQCSCSVACLSWHRTPNIHLATLLATRLGLSELIHGLSMYVCHCGGSSPRPDALRPDSVALRSYAFHVQSCTPYADRFLLSPETIPGSGGVLPGLRNVRRSRSPGPSRSMGHVCPGNQTSVDRARTLPGISHAERGDGLCSVIFVNTLGPVFVDYPKAVMAAT